MKILFLVPYPVASSPSQRFRFEQYFDALKKAGYRCTLQSFLTPWGWRIIYQRGRHVQKFTAVVYGFVRRLFVLKRALHADFVFIHREASPAGPPVFEWLIGKVFRKKIIYDFDDAIWLTDNTSENFIGRFIRWRDKTGYICGMSSVVSCGNAYLAEYAKKFNNTVVVNPTTIDTSYHLRQSSGLHQRVVIGWTGSHSTLKYLEGIVPVMAQLEKSLPGIIFKVIADRDPRFQLASYQFTRFSEVNEINDLADFDIGIMPLPDDEWAKGKCGFKALQYMALEIPAVVSPVGVNTEIIKDGENGFLCANNDEWISKLTILINDLHLRKRIGSAGRETVEERYSVASNVSNFLGLFELSAINTKASR